MHTGGDAPDFRAFLREEMLRRLKRNPSYSARALARDIGVSPAFLSQVLSGKRGLDEARAVSIADRLRWPRRRSRDFTILVRFASTKDPVARERILAELNQGRRSDVAFHDLSLDAFKTIAEWHHYALLELTTVRGFRSSARWVAAKLGITTPEATAAVGRLKRLGLLTERNGKLVKTQGNYSMGDIPSSAIRSFHRQLLAKAAHAIEAQPVSERDFSGITLAIAPERLAEARERIRAFRRELMELLEDGSREAVYHLAIQLFRLDDKEVP